MKTKRNFIYLLKDIFSLDRETHDFLRDFYYSNTLSEEQLLKLLSKSEEEVLEEINGQQEQSDLQEEIFLLEKIFAIKTKDIHDQNEKHMENEITVKVFRRLKKEIIFLSPLFSMFPPLSKPNQ